MSLGTGLVFAALFFTEDIIHLEWTTTAGILGATAVFLYATMPPRESRLLSTVDHAVCLFLFLLCFCLRNTVAYMYLPLLGICWLRKLLAAYKEEGVIRSKRVRGTVIFLLCGVVNQRS